LHHCAINVALYGKPGARWAMTERGRNYVQRSPRRLQIGPSSLQWQGGVLKIDLNEIGAPLPKPIRGSIRVTPFGLPRRMFSLDAISNHLWYPIAPRALVDVRLDRPNLDWTGTGYLDSNFGAEPLENGFHNWSWSRAHLKSDAVVLYDANRQDGTDMSLALRFQQDGLMQSVASPPLVQLPRTRWRIARQTRADDGHIVLLRRTLEDTPFYARSLLETQIFGENADIFHESLSLDRFDTKIVRAMLPFRMPRRIF
jgi:carotenoid 1,2-hydratase